MAQNTLNGYFLKPAVGGDTDTWGSTLNSNWDTVDEILVGDSDIRALSIVADSSTVPLICNAQSATDIAAAFSGKVGIGTANPQEELHISSTLPKLRMQDSDGTNQYGECYHSAGTTVLTARNNTANGSIQLKRFDGTTATTSMHIDTSGNVGIGTTSPDSALEVQGNVNGVHQIHIQNNFDDDDNDTPNPSARLYLSAASNNAFLKCEGSPEDTAGLHRIILGSTSADSYLSFVLGSTEHMRIMHSGNVGIGTTNPATVLDIQETTPTLRLQDNQGGNKRLDLSISNDAVGRIKANQSASQLAFETAGTERMRIRADGKVGIGTLNPDEQLHVTSNLKVGGVIRNATFNNGTTADSTVNITCSNGYTSTLNIRGNGQGNGRLFVGQSPSFGGGIEYCGEGDPVLSGGGNDRIVLFRRDNGTDHWTAKNYYNSNDWEFAGKVKADELEGTLMQSIFNQIYPLGCIYESTSSTSPATLFGGTWETYGSGRVLIGSGNYNDGSENKSFTAGSSSGKYNHTLSIDEMPSHRHRLGIPRDQFGSGNDLALIHSNNSDESIEYRHFSKYAGGSGSDADGDLASAGATQKHNNMQPYIVVYRWRRTGLAQ